MKLTPEKAVLIAHKRWLTRDELALYLGFSNSTIHRAEAVLSQTRFPDVARPLFDRLEVDALLEGRKVK